MFEDIDPKPESALPSTPGANGPAAFNAGAFGAPGSDPDDEVAGPADEDALEDSPLADWKVALREDFERWLESVEDIPSVETLGLEDPETPDLESFYAQLAAAGAEARKANRRTAEAFSQWGDTLGRFEKELLPLRESILELKAAAPKENRLSNAYCLVWVELADRMRRLAAAFGHPPAKTWWGADTAWRQVWETQRQGVDIILGHMEGLLKKEGVEPIVVLGQPFDPSVMSAAAIEEDTRRPHHTVVEEIAPGYRRQGELLRPAQVKVTVNKSPS